MSRVIKFRAWDGFKMYDAAIVNGVDWRLLEDAPSGNPVMQFTGLKDKNGKEIYEGDIVVSANGYKGKIEFGVWCYEDDNGSTEGIGFNWDGDEPLAPCSTGQSYEVIGNIYENQDILK